MCIWNTEGIGDYPSYHPHAQTVTQYPYTRTHTLILTHHRLLAVTTFKTYVMADLRKAIRFDKCDCQVSILGGVKSPGIRVEQLEKGVKHEKQDTGTEGEGEGEGEGGKVGSGSEIGGQGGEGWA